MRADPDNAAEWKGKGKVKNKRNPPFADEREGFSVESAW